MNWERLRDVANAPGYLFRVAQSRRRRRRIPVLRDVPGWAEHRFEPGLPGALAGLSPRQRLAVVLVHGYGCTLREVSELTALAHSGHLRITYSNVSSLAPGSGGAGTDDVTFSGRDWNYVSDQTAPPNGRSVNRFAGGRLYYYGPGFVRHPGDPLSWFRETNPAEIPRRDLGDRAGPA